MDHLPLRAELQRVLDDSRREGLAALRGMETADPETLPDDLADTLAELQRTRVALPTRPGH